MSSALPSPTSRLRRFAQLIGLSVLAVTSGLGAMCGPQNVEPQMVAVDGGAGTGAPPPRRIAVPSTPGDWKEVQRLIDEQKFEEASREVEKIRLTAEARNDAPEWTKALVKEVELRMALHGYETAVRFLREQPWPRDFPSRMALNLHYAHALTNYAQMYSWEIGQRERVDTKGAVDLKAWTRDQIADEARRAYQEVWQARAELGTTKVETLKEYIEPNNYPAGVRDTLRDAVSYLAVELLADSAHWTAEQSNDIHQLDFKALLAGSPQAAAALKLDDPKLHPMHKVAGVLDDLEAWHAKSSRPEAALEARLERARRLHSAFTDKDDRAQMRKDLENRLGNYRRYPWWSMGMAELAQLYRDTGDLVKVHSILAEGVKAYPNSPGGQRCNHEMKAIEAPEVQIQSMLTDGPTKRSILVSHRNLDRIHFRAYAVDIEQRIAAADDYNLLPAYEQFRKLLAGGRPVAEWSAELPPTPDYKTHKTYVTPPLQKSGLYVVIASVRDDFGGDKNRLMACNIVVTDLVLLTRQDGGSDLNMTVSSGATGRPVDGAEVTLWQFDWNRKHTKIETRKTDASGDVRFTGRTRDRPYFFVAKKGAEVAVDPNHIYFNQPHDPGIVTASLVYTDRSVYRPTQKLYWKVVAYRGRHDKADYKIESGASITVTLADANGQEVEKKKVTTNQFGTAAGEFTLPAGRLLGSWTVRTSYNGAAHVRVEEYKRPTFEVSIKDPEKPLRLNQGAEITGEAKYYFGLPVTSGAVKWRVQRVPVYPWWWGWFYRAPATVQTIAAGTSEVGKDGLFRLRFTPAADERQKKTPGMSYRYSVSADLTDEGGETRSASRSFRLGFVSVEAQIATDHHFVVEGGKAEVTFTRTNLDGVPRPGNGRYRIVALKQPDKTLLPAEMPADIAGPADDGEGEGDDTAKSGAHRTPGDSLRPRWETHFSPDAVLAKWGDGDEKAAGALAHDAKGVAKVELPALPPGAYRIRYTTTDDFGASYDNWKNLIVAGAAGKKTPIALPLLLLAESTSVKVGEKARFLALSGLSDPVVYFDVYRDGKLAERRRLGAGAGSLIEIPVEEAARGGFGVRLSTLRDHQHMMQTQVVFVPWDNKELQLSFSTFRDKLRPGAKETFRVTVKGQSGKVEAGTAEVLGYMYDRSLDVFAPHSPPSTMALWPSRGGVPWMRATLTSNVAQHLPAGQLYELPGAPGLHGDQLRGFDGYGIGGMGGGGPRGGMAFGVRSRAMHADAPGAPPPAQAAAPARRPMGETAEADALEAPPAEMANAKLASGKDSSAAAAPAQEPIRSNFAETAFFRPQLITDGNGSAAIEFTVPDSVTSWKVWAHAVTRDLRGGSISKETRSVKELMVRPYLPRFLRESDEAELKVVVNNASDKELRGELSFNIEDPEKQTNLNSRFGVKEATKSFVVPAGGGTNLTFPVKAPRQVGTVAFRVIAKAADLSDGELRPLPVLPGRLHLAQSKFVTLRDADKRVLQFADMAKGDDPSLDHESLIVTIDAQLFYTVLKALPYLVEYPYECTEQTLNRFVSSGIVSTVYDKYPAVGAMAKELSKRDTRLETWDAADPNRKMTLEESPWLQESKGGPDIGLPLIKVLDPRIARAQRDEALAKLKKAQTSSGGFPWFPGGPPSPYMTLYIMYGFAKASEFGVDVPRDVVQRGWQYLARHFREEYVARMTKEDCCWEFLTFLNYVASSYPDASWMGSALTAEERKKILDFSFKHWKQHSPYLKGQLALTLKRMGRKDDAVLVFASVMDSAKTAQDQGTFWAPEDRAWLWYNDTIESHAFALRTLMEVMPADKRADGLVLWLLLNKKLSHWKSTRATAEVIYSLVHYMKREGSLGVREEALVTVGPMKQTFAFEPDRYQGKAQLVIAGEQVDGKSMSSITVEKQTKGVMFASATWHFSTEKLPAEERGDLFQVSRKYFRRINTGKEFVIQPLAEGQAIKPGDEIEVQLSLRSKHAAEYVHLRDPRAAGLEPDIAVSRWKWDLGISWYEEIRDSGTNFFFEWLPAGEYTFKYRVRANLAGTFRVGPATIQSMYAPEFVAYTAGNLITVSK